jgi:hypothetical protein
MKWLSWYSLSYAWKDNNYWFQTIAILWMLYSFLLVILRRLNFMCRRFGTLCSYHLWRWNRVFRNINSFTSLYDDRPKAFSKTSSHIVRSRASSFRWEYPRLSLSSSNSFLRLIPRLSVTSIPTFIFRSVTFCRRLFLLKTWPIQLTVRLLS